MKAMPCIVAICLAASGRAATIRVPADYPSIQAGIDAAANGDVVLVSPGSYYEALNFSGKAITVASKFLETGDPTNAWTTIITPPPGLSGVTASSGEGTNSQLVGFTIEGCSGLNASAIYCYEGSLTVSDCRMISNQCRGVILYKSASVLRGNEVRGNPSFAGGGPFNAIHCAQSGPLIEGNTIWATDPNGNIDAIYHSTTEFATNLQTIIRSNVIYGRLDGEFHTNGPTHLIQRNLFIVENGFGQAMMITGGDSGLKICNNTIWGGDFNVQLGATPDFFNNIVAFGHYGIDLAVFAPRPDVRYNEFWHCPLISSEFMTNGNTFSDPRFVNTNALDLRLQADSPCIDAGSPATFDADGTRADQGAFSFDSTYQGWLQRNFSPAILADTNGQETIWGTSADPDLDGSPNLYEYFCAANPLQADAQLQRLALSISNASVQVTFRRSAHLSGVTNWFQESFALPAWSAAIGLEQVVADLGDAVLVKASFQSTNGSDRFFRLKLAPDP